MKVDAESNVSLGQVYGLAINGTGVAGSKSRFPATLLKNAGLVHIHLVQSKAPEASKDIATPPSHGLFRSILGFEVEWPEGDTRYLHSLLLLQSLQCALIHIYYVGGSCGRQIASFDSGVYSCLIRMPEMTRSSK